MNRPSQALRGALPGQAVPRPPSPVRPTCNSLFAIPPNDQGRPSTAAVLRPQRLLRHGHRGRDHLDIRHETARVRRRRTFAGALRFLIDHRFFKKDTWRASSRCAGTACACCAPRSAVIRLFASSSCHDDMFCSCHAGRQSPTGVAFLAGEIDESLSRLSPKLPRTEGAEPAVDPVSTVG